MARPRSSYQRYVQRKYSGAKGARKYGRQVKRFNASSKRRTARVVKGYTRRAGFYGINRSSEMKFIDYAQAYVFSTTASVLTNGQLAIIAQGDTESTRDGRKATLTAVECKGILTLFPAAAAVVAGTVVMYLVQDMQCNGAAAAITDIFTSAALPASRNLENASRFKILKKFEYVFNPAAGVGGAFNTAVWPIDWYGKVNIPIIWDNTASTGAITTIRSNNLFLVGGSNGPGMNAVAVFNGNVRVRFTG